MSNQLPEQEIQAPAFVPASDDPVESADQLAALEEALETFPSEIDLIVAQSEPQPVGRSWSFDWKARGFIRGASRGPLLTRGTEALLEWVEKALMTARGAHPVHAGLDYGFEGGLAASVIGLPVGTVPADFEQKIEDCLTFHPRVSAVESFDFDFDPDDDWLDVAFTLILDDETEVPASLRLTV